MSNLSPLDGDEIQEQIANIIRQFQIFQCAECAEKIKKWLKANGTPGIHLKLKVKGRGQFIVSQRWDEGRTTITLNGTHYGIEVSDRVFDNLSTTGLSREEWIADFDCPSGQFIIEEIETF